VDALAHQPSSAFHRIEQPVLGRQGAGVDAVDERPGRGDRAEQFLEPRGVGREATVEPNGEHHGAGLPAASALQYVVVMGFSENAPSRPTAARAIAMRSWRVAT
jgi:hypothetical protein